jgi:hypothetical protein
VGLGTDGDKLSESIPISRLILFKGHDVPRNSLKPVMIKDHASPGLTDGKRTITLYSPRIVFVLPPKWMKNEISAAGLDFRDERLDSMAIGSVIFVKISDEGSFCHSKRVVRRIGSRYGPAMKSRPRIRATLGRNLTRFQTFKLQLPSLGRSSYEQDGKRRIDRHDRFAYELCRFEAENFHVSTPEREGLA